jgi:hypothetical protein
MLEGFLRPSMAVSKATLNVWRFQIYNSRNCTLAAVICQLHFKNIIALNNSLN